MAKPTKWRMPPAKTQISLGIRPVWSVFAVHSMDSWRPSVSSCGQRRLIKLDGCPGWSESSLGAFLSKRAQRWLIQLWMCRLISLRREIVRVWILLWPCLCFFSVILTILRPSQHYYIYIQPFLWRAWEGMVNQSLWPIFHGPLIFPYISKTIW